MIVRCVKGQKSFLSKVIQKFSKEVALKKLLVLCTTMYHDA